MEKMLCFLLLITIMFHLPTDQFLVVVEGKEQSFIVDLIHRDSQHSPSYNKSLTHSQILRKAALRSKSRINYFNTFAAAATRRSTTTVRSTVYPNGGDYLMKFYVGTPPKPFFAIADTGSDLIWVQCTKCNKCFAPQRSSTYHQLSCSARSCHQLPRYGCSRTSKCVYDYRYGSGNTYTKGILSSDTISLDSTTGRVVAFPASTFGCGYDYAGSFFTGPSSGLVGLGGGPLSLISQLGPKIGYKFSYCLVPFSSSFSSKLRFGQSATLYGRSVVSTPLITKTDRTFYYLSLRSITIGQRTTKTPQNFGNIIIDSGTTLTFLGSKIYNEVEQFVKQAIAAKPVQDTTKTFRLCYGQNSVSRIKLPNMVFNFPGAKLSLPPRNTFVLYNNLVCMNILPSNGLSIFGNMAHVNFEVEYDIRGKKVHFAAADCTKF